MSCEDLSALRSIGVMIYPLHTKVYEINMAKMIFGLLKSINVNASDILRVYVNRDMGYARIHTTERGCEDYLMKTLLDLRTDTTLFDLSTISTDPQNMNVVRIRNIVYDARNQINFCAMSNEGKSTTTQTSSQETKSRETATPTLPPCSCQESKFYFKYQKLTSESRYYEYKAGAVLFHYALTNILPKYICGFLNSEGGIIYFGVNDDGQVVGVWMNKRTEQLIMEDIIYYVKQIKPEVKREDYSVNFAEVRFRSGQPYKNLKVVEICIKPRSCPEVPYTFNGTVFMRRDGSTQSVGLITDIKWPCQSKSSIF